jgi:hypothetical protein
VPAPSCEAAYWNGDADAREREITETTMQMVLFASLLAALSDLAAATEVFAECASY